MNSIPDEEKIMFVPLRQCMASEHHHHLTTTSDPNAQSRINIKSLLRTTTVAYGIAELCKHVVANEHNAAVSTGSNDNNDDGRHSATACAEAAFVTGRMYDIDNFVVGISRKRTAAPTPTDCEDEINKGTTGGGESWNDGNVVGVSMISPALNVHIYEPSFLVDLGGMSGGDPHDEKDTVPGGRMGAYLEADITDPSSPAQEFADMALVHRQVANLALAPGHDIADGRSDCQQFGMLLYQIYSGVSPSPATDALVTQSEKRGGEAESATQVCGCVSAPITRGDVDDDDEPASKRSTNRCHSKEGSAERCQQPYDASLREMGLPSSISMLVQHLIDGRSDLYPSLEAASKDLHMLLCDPECYLFDNHQVVSSSGPSSRLRIKEGKVYGRENEVSLITDAFCKVSSGKRVAFFIGGYSGSGKTMLVQSVKARVNAVGGYVLTRKIDEMSRERPFLDILSAFDNLCLLIRDENSPRALGSIKDRLLLEFENDFFVLARLLPNVTLIVPQLDSLTKEVQTEQINMNSYTVSFILQRFIRIVSSREKPIMLFLDDLQWAKSPALDLIYGILSDTRGSSCLLFVGSYRDNEVDEDHHLFELMVNLELCGVDSSTLHLSGLNSEDLNVMVSEFLCILPRICKPLSDIVFSKTEGNPFFALEFLRSLVDSRLLEFSLREMRWIWDCDEIIAENLTDNVLYLLTKKITQLPRNVQLALQVLSCFGIKANESIVGYLSSTLQYSNFSECLSLAIGERIIQKTDKDFKFVHDKVREASYNLIPDNNKSQFHHEIGILIYLASRGGDLGEAIFQIVDQVNMDLSLVKHSMQLDIAKINFSAGLAAINQGDFSTSHSYLTNALALLPKDHWRNQYDFSLRLFFVRAKAAYSCGNADEAKESLTTMIEKGHSLDDILGAYHYYIVILLVSEKREEAYEACCKVLSQLNRALPFSIDGVQATSIANQFEVSLSRMSNQDWYTIKPMDGARNKFIMKFYTILFIICFRDKANAAMVPMLAYQMIQFTLDHGLSSDSVIGLMQYAAIQSHLSIAHVQGAHRLGKVAMNLSKRFNQHEMVTNLYYYYYGFVATYTEPMQACSDMLRKAVEVGMSTGEFPAFTCFNTIFIVRCGMLGGENLSSLIRDTDYYLDLSRRFDHKLSQIYLSIYRGVISALIGKSASSSQSAVEEESIHSTEAHVTAVQISRLLVSFWQGHTERCSHFAGKLLRNKNLGSHNRVFVAFYSTLNSFRAIRSRNGAGSKYIKIHNIYPNAIKVLKSAERLSSWNYSNKVLILAAEYCSFEKKNENAKAAYAAAISSSCSSNFIHEQGLACELAGFHFRKIDENKDAMDFFNQAKDCYAKWGSQMKVDFIQEQLGKF